MIPMKGDYSLRQTWCDILGPRALPKATMKNKAFGQKFYFRWLKCYTDCIFHTIVEI